MVGNNENLFEHEGYKNFSDLIMLSKHIPMNDFTL